MRKKKKAKWQGDNNYCAQLVPYMSSTVTDPLSIRTRRQYCTGYSITATVQYSLVLLYCHSTTVHCIHTKKPHLDDLLLVLTQIMTFFFMTENHEVFFSQMK